MSKTVVLPAGGGNYDILRDGDDLVLRVQRGRELLRQPAILVSLLTVTGSSRNDAIVLRNSGGTVDTPLVFNGGAGNDSLLVDFAGSLTLPGGLTYNGGGGSRDSLMLRNLDNVFDELTYRSPTTRDGGFELVPLGGGPETNIAFAGLRSVSIDGTAVANMIFELSNRNDIASLQDIRGNGNERFVAGGQVILDFPLDGVSSLIVNGNDGNDRITVSSLDPAFAGRLTLNGNIGNDTLDASGAKKRIARVTTGIDTELNGGDGKDYLIGGIGNDTLDGGNGNDTSYGTSGHDLLFGGNDNDYLDGGLGNDTILGGAGKDTILGGFGDDALSGGTQNDYLDGGSGNDTLLGDAGNDTLRGSSGADILLGGDDNDNIYAGPALRNTPDIVACQGGNDRIYDPTREIDEAFTL